MEVLLFFSRIQQQPSRRYLLRDLRTLQRYTHELGPGMKSKNSHHFALVKNIYVSFSKTRTENSSLTVNSV